MASLARRLLCGLILGLSWADYPSARADQGHDAEPAQATRSSSDVARAVTDLATWVREQGGKLGVAILDCDSQQLLASSNPSGLLNPASNQKLVTAAAALSRLGPAYRFTTGVYGEIKNGAAQDLVLRGHGDPSLTTADLWRMAASLAGMGLRRVEGTLYVDQSRFDDQFVPPAFEQQPNEWASFRAPISAVALDGNSITLHVEPTEAGRDARVWFDPPGVVLTSGSVATEARGKGNTVRLSVHEAGGRLRAELGGHVAEGLPTGHYRRRLDDPRLAPGYALKQILQQLGVQVSGEVALGRGKAAPALVSHQSEPLARLIEELGKDSDNFYAEMLLKTLAAEARGTPATSAAGAEAVVDWLKQVGAFQPGTVVTNGSGLFEGNRISALTLARTLVAAYRDPATRPEYVAHLAVGGVDGTLRSRFRSLRSSRIIRAKTGTLNQVVSLSGYVLPPASRSAIAYSFIVTGLPGKHGESRRRIDRVVTALAEQLHGKL